MLVGLHEILKILPMAKAMFEMEKNSISEMFLHFLAEEKWFPYLSIQNFKFLWQLQMWTEEARLLDSLLMFPVYAFIVSASGSQKKNQNGRHLKEKIQLTFGLLCVKGTAPVHSICARGLAKVIASSQFDCLFLMQNFRIQTDRNVTTCDINMHRPHAHARLWRVLPNRTWRKCTAHVHQSQE